MNIVGDFEQHTLPNGAEVYYRDSDHSYYSAIKPKGDGFSGSGRLTGVSTVVAPFDWQPDNLMRWAARINGEGIATLAAEGLSQESADDMRACLGWLGTSDSIDSALADAELRYTDARDAAAARGTNVHRHALHALATGQDVPRRDDMTEEEWGYARGVIDFWLEHDPTPVYSEQIACDLDLGVVGRFDLLADLTLNGVRQRVMLDAKTASGSGFVPVKHHVQLAGYEHCALACGLIDRPLDCGLILMVDAMGGYELVAGQSDVEDFRVVVDLYRRAARIKRESNAARKAA